jgi:hypothetical protein
MSMGIASDKVDADHVIVSAAHLIYISIEECVYLRITYLSFRDSERVWIYPK